MVKNLPSNAGDLGSIAGWGTKIPHAAGATKPVRAANYRAHALWSPSATTSEPTCPGAHAPQLEREKPARRNWREARMPQRRSHVPQLRPDAAKKKKKKKVLGL